MLVTLNLNEQDDHWEGIGDNTVIAARLVMVISDYMDILVVYLVIKTASWNAYGKSNETLINNP